jgi:putative heme-binding domain-containing protein
MRTTLFSLPALLALAVIPVAAQRDLKNIPDPDPELERKTFQLAEGFEVNLYAADPLLAKPIQMNFDPEGRLWVACSETYPMIEPGKKANDRIVVLEDTKGVGKADKATLFADGLLIPSGVEPGDGGVYVGASTELLHFSDPDDKGKARKTRVVLSGFGTEDTHHTLHTLRWGDDGRLYFNQSVYIHSHIETPYGVRRLNAGGVWWFRPDTEQLEVYTRGLWNSWGHHWDRWGQDFLTDGAGGEGINYVIPGAAYTPNNKHVLPGLNPGSPKYCGLEVLSGSHLPEDWRGDLITHDFRGHRVCRFKVVPDGAGFQARLQADLVKTDHAGFRPIDVKMGPDGAIYIADWYNPIIQHGEVDFRDPRRDHTHGRIWRITAKGRPLVERPALGALRKGDIQPSSLDFLKAPEQWTRHQGRRVLQERGATAVLPALDTWTAKLSSDENRLEALWTYQALDRVEPKLLATLLSAGDYRIRAAAVRVVGAWASRLSNAPELLAPRVADEHPQVRLEAVRALALIPSARSAEIALTALDRPVDRFVDYGLTLTLMDLQGQWLPALQAGKFDFGGNVPRLLYALKAAGSPQVVPALVALVRQGKIAKDGEEGVLQLIASLGGADDLALVWQRVLSGNLTPRGQAVALAALEQAARSRSAKPSGDVSKLASLLASPAEPVRIAVAELAGTWKLASARDELLRLGRAEGIAPAERAALLNAVAAIGGDDAQKALIRLTSDYAGVEVRLRAIPALAILDAHRAAQAAVVILPELKPEAVDELIDGLVRRKGGAGELVKALADKKLTPDVARLAIRAARASGREDPALVAALGTAGGLDGKPRKFTPAETTAFLADLPKMGDAKRGEAIYRRKEMTCLKCHAIGGAGGQVGPDLTSIGASAQADYLLESLLEPSKAIKENYHSLVVTNKEGKVVTGIKIRQTKDELVLRTAEDKEVVIPIRTIDEQEQGKSLMPEGLTDPLTRAELLDLVRFLSELGKIGPYSVSKARLVRRWQVLEATKDAYRPLATQGHQAVTSDDPAFVWGSAYSTVAGDLLPAELPSLTIKRPAPEASPTISFVRFHLDVSTPGDVILKLNSTEGLRAWLDTTPVDVKTDTKLKLASGPHAVTLAIDRDVRKEALRVELDEAPGSPVRVRLIGGK